MRILILAGLIFLVATSPATAASRSFGVSGFDRVRVDGPFKVRLSTGRAPFAKASGSQRAIDRIAIDVQGRTLVVHTSQSSWSSPTAKADDGPVEIEIGTHDLDMASLNGAGTLAIDKVRGLDFTLTVIGSGAASIAQADVDKLTVGVSGTSSATLAGKAKTMAAVIRGISTLDAGGLSVRDATVGVEGAATVAAQVTNAIKVTGSGPGTVALTGRPSCTLKLLGSGSVTGCR